MLPSLSQDQLYLEIEIAVESEIMVDRLVNPKSPTDVKS